MQISWREVNIDPLPGTGDVFLTVKFEHAAKDSLRFQFFLEKHWSRLRDLWGHEPCDKLVSSSYFVKRKNPELLWASRPDNRIYLIEWNSLLRIDMDQNDKENLPNKLGWFLNKVFSFRWVVASGDESFQQVFSPQFSFFDRGLSILIFHAHQFTDQCNLEMNFVKRRICRYSLDLRFRLCRKNLFM